MSEADEAVAALRRGLSRAIESSQVHAMPDALPGLLVARGAWTVDEALCSVDHVERGPSSGALLGLAPWLSAEQAIAALGRVRRLWDDWFNVEGALAVARRAVQLGAAEQAVAVVERFAADGRGLVLARLMRDLPERMHAAVLERAAGDLRGREGDRVCIAYMALAEAVPSRRDELVERGMQALFDGDDSAYPYVLEWLAYAGARPRAVAYARMERGLAYPRAQALAAVIPWCREAERAALWREWRSVLDEACADRYGLSSLRLPLPASDEELEELLALVRGRPGVRERAVALAHVAVHHDEVIDEALAAIRGLEGVDRALGLSAVLPVCDEACGEDVAREVLGLLEDPGDLSELHNTAQAWPVVDGEPARSFHVHTPRLGDLRARATARLPADEGTEAALLLADESRAQDDKVVRASAIAAFASGLEGEERAAALVRATELAWASARPFVGLSQVLRRSPVETRRGLAEAALAVMGALDEAVVSALPPVIAALPAEVAGELVVRVLEEVRSGGVHMHAAVVAAGLRAGAVDVVAPAVLDGDMTRYHVHLLLPYADAELRPRVVEALIGSEDDGEELELDLAADLVACVKFLNGDELGRLVSRLPPPEVRYTKRGGDRDPLIAACVRPLAERGRLEELRPALATLNRELRLPALATALDLLPADERATVVRQLLGDMRRGAYVPPEVKVSLAAGGHAEALLDLELGVSDLVAIAPHVSGASRDRLRARVLEVGARVTDLEASLELVEGFDRVPDGALVRALTAAIDDAAASGCKGLLEALAGSEADHGARETGVTRALLRLAGARACIDALA